MNDYLAKPIEEEKLHNLLLRYKPGANVAARLMAPEPAEFIFNPNATLDWQLAPAVLPVSPIWHGICCKC